MVLFLNNYFYTKYTKYFVLLYCDMSMYKMFHTHVLHL